MGYQTTITLGQNVEEAEANARQLARDFYAQAPINDARGQTFKNVFVESLFDISERCRRMGSYLTGGGCGDAPKPVVGPAYMPQPEQTKEEVSSDVSGGIPTSVFETRLLELENGLSMVADGLNDLRSLISEAGETLSEA